MLRVAHGTAYFKETERLRVLELMRAQCSAIRSAYQAGRKHGLHLREISWYVKKNYMSKLNQRYVANACSCANLPYDSVLFGGRKNWNKLKKGELTKQEWQQIRNNKLYSRGDKTKEGNPNIRVNLERGRIRVNDPNKRGLWIEGNLYLPKKWSPDLSCYGVRLIFKNGKFFVKISWEEVAKPKMKTIEGAVGVDTNPDGVAFVNIDKHGNILEHRYYREQRIQFARQDKRKNDIRLLAKMIVSEAKERQKKIVLEKLDFHDRKVGKKKMYKKFLRMKSNFTHRELTTSIKSRAEKEFVPVVEISPAFTSVLGKIKYEKMYSLNRHDAAALVIARRGMGIKEKQTFMVVPREKERLTLEGRGCSETLTLKAWTWLKDCFLKPKPTILTGSLLVPARQANAEAGLGSPSESIPTTGRYGKVERLSG